MRKLPEWVFQNLEKYGNCYVRNINNYNLEEITKRLNKEYNTKAVEDGNGFVIELKGVVVNDI